MPSVPAVANGNVAVSVLTEAERQFGQRENLLKALSHSGGKVSGPGGAAELLGVKPTTLYSRIKRHGIDLRRFKEASASR